MSTITFKNNITLCNKIRGFFSANELMKEKSCFYPSLEFAKTHGGLIIRDFVNNLPEPFLNEAKSNNRNIIITSRLLYLKVGNYPLAPRWHCDDPFYDFRYPLYGDDYSRDKQVICTVSTHPDGISNPDFFIKDINVNMKQETDVITWYDINNKVIEKINNNNIYKSKDGEIILFDNKTLHCATAAKNEGLRLLIKAHVYPSDIIHNS
jgi:hypothetical protein